MSLRRGSAVLLVVLTACSHDLSRGGLSPTAPSRASLEAAGPFVTTVMEDGTPADLGGAVAADVISVAGLTKSVEAAPVNGPMTSLASDGSVRTLIVYPYGGNNGVPPIATLGANGITATYHTGPNLNSAVLANYDVVFVGRNATLPFLRPAPLTINVADVVAWINNGGTLVSETNAVGFDSDASGAGNFSSTMRNIFGITTPNGGFDCGAGNLPVAVNTAHPLAAGLPASFTAINSGGFLAYECPPTALNPAANPTVVQWGSWNSQPLTTSTYGSGCTVWLGAVGFGNINWAAQPNLTQLYVNALRGCGALSLPSDDTPPVITPTVSGTLGNNGWYTSAVNVSWTVTDDESTVSSTSGCDAVTQSTDTGGVTLTCSATSDGGTASESVTIKVDQTAPVVTITGNAGSYTVDQMVNIGCAYSDNLSGMALQFCTGASGPAWSIGLGTHAVSGSGTDNAGNTGTASGSFSVSVTAGSLCNLVNAWVTQHGIANSMCQQLANGAYGAFQNHVRAQRGKSVAADKAAILIDLASSL